MERYPVHTQLQISKNCFIHSLPEHYACELCLWEVTRIQMGTGGAEYFNLSCHYNDAGHPARVSIINDTVPMQEHTELIRCVFQTACLMKTPNPVVCVHGLPKWWSVIPACSQFDLIQKSCLRRWLVPWSPLLLYHIIWPSTNHINWPAKSFILSLWS